MNRGFLECFRSVRCAVLQVLQALLVPAPHTQHRPSNGSSRKKKEKREGTEEVVEKEENKEEKKWQIYTTGHSLGGALATLCAFEIGRLREGEWGTVCVRPSCLTLPREIN